MLETDSLPEEVVARQRAIPLGIAYARTGQKAKSLAAKLKIASKLPYPGRDTPSRILQRCVIYHAK